MFIASKILGALAAPASALLLLLLWGTWVRWANHGRRGNKRVAAALTGLLLAAFTPLSAWVLLPLEDRFPRPLLGDGTGLDGIIVLGGALSADVSAARDRFELNRSADRIVDAAMLARQFPGLPLIYSGGSGAAFRTEVPEAKLAAQQLQALGVAASRIRLEDKSRTTAENAAQVHEMLAPGQSSVPGRWLLITSASHMARSVGAFRMAGFDVLPYPVDYQTAGDSDRWRLFTAPSQNLLDLDTAAKEWAGLLVYWLRGQSNEVFPGPVATAQ